MAQTEKVKTLIESLVDSLDLEQLLKLLDPCTRLTITLKINRGQVEITKESTYRITQIKHRDLVRAESINESLWRKIFSLRAFSNNPERARDKRFRKVLLEMKRKGSVAFERGINSQSAINEILRGNNVECRMVTFTSDEGHHSEDALRIVEIW